MRQSRSTTETTALSCRCQGSCGFCNGAGGRPRQHQLLAAMCWPETAMSTSLNDFYTPNHCCLGMCWKHTFPGPSQNYRLRNSRRFGQALQMSPMHTKVEEAMP